jgi:hypothetical protein
MAFVAHTYNVYNTAQQNDANELIQSLLECNPEK